MSLIFKYLDLNKSVLKINKSVLIENMRFTYT